MLRKSLMKTIHESLIKEPYIYAEDFDIHVKNGSSNTQLRIRYICDGVSYFNADISDSDDTEIGILVNPGKLTDIQSSSVKTQSSLLTAIKGWVARLEDDLLAEPDFRAIEQMQQRMADVEERLADLPDNPASPEQIEKLHSLLSDIESRLQKQIEELQLSVEDKAEKLAALQSQFEVLHSRVNGGTVKRVLRTIAARVYRTAADPDLPKIIENGRKIVGLLGDQGIPPS